MATDLLSTGEAGKEYPLPYQQRGPGQVSDYQSGGAHQPNRGKTVEENTCHATLKITFQHTLHKSLVSWLKQPEKVLYLL